MTPATPHQKLLQEIVTLLDKNNVNDLDRDYLLNLNFIAADIMQEFDDYLNGLTKQHVTHEFETDCPICIIIDGANPTPAGEKEETS